jgi:putative ABC transport system permease protein
MRILDSLGLAYRTVRSNKLRTGLTVAIIAFGIMALVGIITAIDAMNESLKDSFSLMGANSFSIRYREMNIRMGGGGRSTTMRRGNMRVREKRSNQGKVITYVQAKEFKERYAFPAKVSVGIGGIQSQIIYYGNKETNPNVRIQGGDENYLSLNGYEVEYGRDFNKADLESGRAVCVLGHDVADKLFGDRVDRAVEKDIRVGSRQFRVIGVLKAKGASAFLQMDNVVITTINTVRRMFPVGRSSYYIGVSVPDVARMSDAIGEAEGTFRPIRGLISTDVNNFYIDKSDAIAETFIKSLSTISSAAGAIGFITLIGAAIALMNIMLVAVNERTKEVGLIKAIGGKRSSVRQQFLFESILISLMGAVIGILLGVLVGNIVGSLMDVSFFVPWGLVAVAILICSAVGLGAGLYPAWKASKLDPIVALRYE